MLRRTVALLAPQKLTQVQTHQRHRRQIQQSCASHYGRHQADAQQVLARHVQPVHRLRSPQQKAAKQRRTQHRLAKVLERIRLLKGIAATETSIHLETFRLS